MAKVTIGKVEYDLPELNFKSIKKIWPLIAGLQGDDQQTDLVELMDVSSKVLEIALERSSHPLTREEIEDQMLGSEIPNIQASVMDLLVESGLMQRMAKDAAPGEAAGAAASPSTETGTDSLPNSSQPDVPAGTGRQ